MKRLVLALAVSALVVAPSFADDVVVLKNGDKLTGKVVSLSGGKLKFTTAHSGDVLVDWGQIASLTTDAPHKVKLDSGEIIEGRLSAGEGGRLRIESPALTAPAEVEPAKVAKINEPPSEWHGFIEAGGRVTGGNTRTKSASVAAELLRETDIDRFLIKAQYRYGENRGVMTERNAYGQIKYDYKFTPKFYGYISEELFMDTFRDLRIRTVSSVGAGYIFWKGMKYAGDLDTDMWAEAGLAYVTNDFRDARDEGHFGGRLFHHLRLALPLGLEFVNDVTFYPNFERSRDWQLRDEGSIGVGLGKGWTFRAGVILDIDHEPPPGFHRHDVAYFANLGWKF